MLNPEKFNIYNKERAENEAEEVKEVVEKNKVSYEEAHSLIERKDKLELLKKKLDPVAISKEKDNEGRKIISKEILANRLKLKEHQENIAEKEKVIQEMKDKEVFLREKKEKKEEELREKRKSILSKIRNTLGINDKGIIDLESGIKEIQSEITRLNSHYPWGTIREEQEFLKTIEEERKEMPRSQEIIGAYHEKMSNIPLNIEEKKEFLNQEILSELSMEEYICLWRRLNPHFLTHITRQGFRDHYGHIYHMAGMEKFHNNFISLLEDDKLIRSPFAIDYMRQINKDSVEDLLKRGGVFNKESIAEAEEQLEKILHRSVASIPSYPDKTAVHFGVQEVASENYGAEEDNEIFFVFPSDVLASQYNFSFGEGGASSFNKEKLASMTDALVWPKETNNSGISVEMNGISVDMGIVFLPKDILVDPETGSKYVSESKEVNGEIKRDVIDSEDNFFEEGYFNKEKVEKIMEKNNMHLKRAKEIFGAIRAEDFWENFFDRNPELKPKHIYYYNGNPTQAILEFQQKNNIGIADTSRDEDTFLGFDDHFVDMSNKEDARVYPGHRELIEIASEIIKDRYIEQGDH